MYNPMLDTFIAVSNYQPFVKDIPQRGNYQSGGASVYFTHCRYETDERA